MIVKFLGGAYGFIGAWAMYDPPADLAKATLAAIWVVGGGIVLAISELRR